MFMVFSKDKIISYLISLSTVTLLFIMSFAITKRNEEIIKTSANAVITNNIEEIGKNEVIENNIQSNENSKANNELKYKN